MDGHDSIAIAVLTDSQDDVQLINSAIRDAGHAAHCHWVASPETLDVLSPEEGATGRHLYQLLEELGMGLDADGRSFVVGELDRHRLFV